MSSVAPSSSSRYVDVRSRTPDLREQQRPAAISQVCPPLRDRLRLRVSAHLSDPLSSRQQEQGNKSRIRGIEAQKAEHPGGEIRRTHLRSSLGPKVRRAGPTDLAWKGAQRTPIAN